MKSNSIWHSYIIFSLCCLLLWTGGIKAALHHFISFPHPDHNLMEAHSQPSHCFAANKKENVDDPPSSPSIAANLLLGPHHPVLCHTIVSLSCPLSRPHDEMFVPTSRGDNSPMSNLKSWTQESNSDDFEFNYAITLIGVDWPQALTHVVALIVNCVHHVFCFCFHSSTYNIHIIFYCSYQIF